MLFTAHFRVSASKSEFFRRNTANVYDHDTKNLLNPTFTDTILLAKIKDELSTLQHEGLLNRNMHDPCDHLNPSGVCMIDDTYYTVFPEYFVVKTGHD